MEDLKVAILKKCGPCPIEQEIAELRYINRFQTISKGLKKQSGLQHITIVNQ